MDELFNRLLNLIPVGELVEVRLIDAHNRREIRIKTLLAKTLRGRRVERDPSIVN